MRRRYGQRYGHPARWWHGDQQFPALINYATFAAQYVNSTAVHDNADHFGFCCTRPRWPFAR